MKPGLVTPTEAEGGGLEGYLIRIVQIEFKRYGC